MKRTHFFVSGDVQGVFYRVNARHFAKELGLTGWVRNLEDGRVELVAEGLESELKEFIKLLERGPITAHVEETAVEWTASENEFKDFKVLY